MMKPISAILLILALSGCTAAPGTNRTQSIQGNQSAIDSLNIQIKEFNANRISQMGITPIDRRVSRIEYNSKSGQITTYDQDNKLFFVLKRKADGRFQGIVETPYHQAAFSGPGGPHSWGHVLAKFYLEKGIF